MRRRTHGAEIVGIDDCFGKAHHLQDVRSVYQRTTLTAVGLLIKTSPMKRFVCPCYSVNDIADLKWGPCVIVGRGGPSESPVHHRHEFIQVVEGMSNAVEFVPNRLSVHLNVRQMHFLEIRLRAWLGGAQRVTSPYNASGSPTI